MDTIGAYEAKTHLPQLLERVAKGETITITKHGVPVAVLSPPKRQQRMTTEETLQAFRDLRERIAARGEFFTTQEITEMIDEGRKH
jgi:prevent-host-death family protein